MEKNKFYTNYTTLMPITHLQHRLTKEYAASEFGTKYI